MREIILAATVTFLSVFILQFFCIFVKWEYDTKKHRPSIFFKSAASLLPSIFAVFYINSLSEALLFAGLLICPICDIIIEKSVFGGIASFMVAQILFSVSFIIEYGFGPVSLLTLFFSMTIIFFVIKYGMTHERLKAVASVYGLVISFMLAAAIPSFSLHTTSSLFTVLGASLFLFSDGVLAVNLSRKPSPQADFLIMTTYYLSLSFFSFSIVFS